MDYLSKNIHWLLRLSLFGTFLAHGIPKLGGNLGMGVIGYLVGPFEFFGGLFLIVGYFTKDIITRIGGLLLSIIMFGAIFIVHLPEKFTWMQGNGGVEWPVLLLSVSLLFVIKGNDI